MNNFPNNKNYLSHITKKINLCKKKPVAHFYRSFYRLTIKKLYSYQKNLYYTLIYD